MLRTAGPLDAPARATVAKSRNAPDHERKPLNAQAEPARPEGLDSYVLDHMSTWIELFYDLVFVAAILIFSLAVAHVHPSSGIVWIVLVFAASWWVWFTTTACANRFHMADVPHRLILLFQMLVIVLMAMEARVSVTGDSTVLALEYGALLLTIAVVAFRSSRLGGPDSAYARRLAILNAGAAVVFLLTALLPEDGRLAVAALGFVLLVACSLVLLHRVKEFSVTDEQHFVERMGAFTLIVCGESFVDIAISVSGNTIDKVDIVSLIFEFVLVFALFTGYFEDIPAAGLNQRRIGWWGILHLVAQVCIAGTAVSASKLIDLRTSHRVPDVEILRLTVPLAAVYLALAGIGVCTRRRPIAPLTVTRLVTAAVVVLVGILAWWVPWIHLAEALPMFTVIAIAHAVVVIRLRSRTHLVDAASLAAH
jgi:low temperature requirement protein LtrA